MCILLQYVKVIAFISEKIYIYLSNSELTACLHAMLVVDIFRSKDFFMPVKNSFLYTSHNCMVWLINMLYTTVFNYNMLH